MNQLRTTAVSAEQRAKLRETESRYHALVETIGDIIFTVDLWGVITSLNPAFERMLGWSRKDWLGKSFETLLHPEDYPRIKSGFLKMLRGKSDTMAHEARVRTASGDYKVFEGTAVPIYEGIKITGVSGIARDITTRKHAENLLRESEDRFRMLVEGVRDQAIFLLDRKGCVASWNAGAELMEGYKEEDILGKHISIFYPKEEVLSEKPWRLLEDAAAKGIVEGEGWRIRKDGSLFWAHTAITAVHDQAGNLKGFVKVSRDFSERRKAEEEIKNLNKELEKRVDDRTEELNKVNTALKREVMRRDRFLATLSHELRNPLAPIILSLDLMRRLGLKNQDAEKRFEVIDHQFRQLSRLLRDLLDISRITSGKIELQLQRLKVCKIVTRAVEAIMPLAEAQGHTLLINLPKEPIFLTADPLRLEQIVVNLLSNAIKYTLNGGNIQLSVYEENDCVKISVRDNGIGIPPHLLSNIFEMFEQGGQLLLATKGGLGIGLALVRHFTELHGGTVEARSGGAGEGSEFIVRFPLHGKDKKSEASS